MHVGAVAAVSSVLVSRTAAGQPMANSGDLLQSLLSVADAHLVFARDLMLSSSVVPAVFDWAVAAAGLREREPVNAGFSYLSHLLAAANKVFAAAAQAAAQQRPSQALEKQAFVLQQCISQHGEQLVRTLVMAACDTAPRQLMRALGGVLYQLLQTSLTGDAGKQWLLAALQAADLPGGQMVLAQHIHEPQHIVPRGDFAAGMCVDNWLASAECPLVCACVNLTALSYLPCHVHWNHTPKRDACYSNSFCTIDVLVQVWQSAC